MFHPHEVLQNIHQVKYNLHLSLQEQVHLFLYLTIDLPYRYRFDQGHLHPMYIHIRLLILQKYLFRLLQHLSLIHI